MNKLKRILFAAGAMSVLAAGWPAALYGQRSDVDIWAQSCGNCHTNQPARRYTADQWGKIVTHMMVTARLTDDETSAVLRFLRRGAREPGDPIATRDRRQTASAATGAAPDPMLYASRIPVVDWQAAPNGAALYSQECKSCHGSRGRGDGRAGRDLDPRPTDLTDEDFQASTSDSAMVAAIRDGKGEMDPIELTPAEILAVVRYVRRLGAVRRP